MTLLFETINNGLMAEAPLETQRLPTFYPSAASCINEENGQVIGTCLRAQWFRCKGYEESNPPGLYSQFIFAAGMTLLPVPYVFRLNNTQVLNPLRQENS